MLPNSKIKKVSNEHGFVYIMFFFLLPVFMVLIALVVDSAKMYSASLKANAIAEGAVTSALIARIHEDKEDILEDIRIENPINATNYEDAPTPDIINEQEEYYLNQRVIATMRRGLRSSGVLTHEQEGSTIEDTNRGLEIVSTTSTIDDGEHLIATVRLRTPTLLMHYVTGKGNLFDRSKAVKIPGTATGLLRGGNYIFVIDLSQSQACPAGSVPGQAYCRCNSANKKPVPDGSGGLRAQTCREEADDPSNSQPGAIRIEKTRDALIRTISKLDTVRDRVAVVGFNTVAFTIIKFRAPETLVGGVKKAKKGFDVDYVVDRLMQLKSIDDARLNGMIPSTPGRDCTSNNNQIYCGTQVPPGPVGNANDLPEDTVPVIVPEGNTNLSDGFLTALQEAKLSGLTSDNGERFEVVYYSDGAPTAMRASFNTVNNTSYNSYNYRDRGPRTFSKSIRFYADTNEANTSVTPNGDRNSYPRLPGWNNDFITYQVVLDLGGGAFVNSFGPIVDTNLYKRWYIWNAMHIKKPEDYGRSAPYAPRNITDPIIANWNDKDRSGYAPHLLPDCMCGKDANKISCHYADYSTYTPSQWDAVKGYIYNKDIFDTDLTKRRNVVSKCFDGGSLEAKMPTADDPNAHAFGTSITPNNMFSAARDFRYLYYMAAMEAAALVRENGGRISGIGYGAEAANLASPVQGLNDVQGLKAGVMANLSTSYDELKAIYKSTDGNGENEIVEFPAALYPGYEKIKDRKNNGVPGGVFVKAPQDADFGKFLDQLLLQIRLSMVRVH